MRSLRSIGLFIIGAALFSACGSGSDDADPDQGAATTAAEDHTAAGLSHVIRVESIVLASRSFDDIIEVTGTVEALDDARLSARTSGTIIQLQPLGTRVGAGYAIAQIDPALANAALEQATAQRDVAKAQLDLSEDLFRRQEPLYRDSIISVIEFEQVKAQLAQAKAQFTQAEALVKQSEEQVGLTLISAPFTGTVEAHYVERGEQVAPGTPVARVVNTARVRVVAGVPERFAGDIKRGSRVRLKFSAYGVAEREATVTFASNAIDASSRTLPIEIEVGNPDGSLKPEMIADVLVTRRTEQEAIVIPLSAVLRDEDGSSVYVIDRSGSSAIAERRQVTLGSSYGGNVVVTNGLSAGDELITVGASSVAPGDVVETLQSQTMTEAL